MASSDNIPEEDKPITRPDLPGLKNQEETAGDKKDGLYNPKGDGPKGEKSASPASLASAESAIASAGPKLGSGFNPVGDVSLPGAGKIRAAFAKHKKRNTALIVVILMFFGIGFGSLTFLAEGALETIEKVLVKADAKIEQKIDKHGAQSVIQHLVCRHLEPGSPAAINARCTADGDPEDSENAEEKAADDADPLAKEMDGFSFTDQSVVQALSEQGIQVNKDASGNFNGLTDTETGKLITVDDISNDTSGIFDRFETALPEWDVDQLETFRPLMAYDADASFDVLPGTEDDNVQKTIEQEVSQGADSAELVSVEEDSNNQEPGKNATAAEQQSATEGPKIEGQTGEALAATENAMANGENETQAIGAGEKVFEDSSGGLDNLTMAGIMSNVCGVKQAADSAAKEEKPSKMQLLMRHFTTIVSVVSEAAANKITGKEANSFMGLLDGDPSAPSTVQDGNKTERNEASLPFSASADWQTDTGNPVNSNKDSPGYTPGLDPTSKPTESEAGAVEGSISSSVDSIGGGLACSVLNSPFGFIVQGFGGLAQIFADDFTLGAAQVGTIAATTAAQQVLQNDIVPLILKFFTPVGLNGLEDSVQWLNNANTGGALAFAKESQREGALPVNTSTGVKAANEATHDETATESHLPFSDRLFATSNPDSLISRIIVSMPNTRSSMALSFADFFTDLPTDLVGALNSIFNRPILAATSGQYPGESAGQTPYDFSDSDISKYDPVANEKYLFGNVCYQGKCNSRIDLLGNPNNYPNASQDSSNDDVLHCFTQGFTSTANDSPNSNGFTGGGNDPICGSEGDYDYASDPPEAPSSPEALSPNDTVMSDPNVAYSYCEQLVPNFSLLFNGACIISMLDQMHNDLGHFREYLLNTHVMTDYKSLTTNSAGGDSGDNSSTATPQVSGNAQQVAKQILSNSNVELTCYNSSVEQDVQNAANNQPGTAGVMTSAGILEIIEAVGQNHKVCVTAIQSDGQGHCDNTPKAECPNDPHYTGHAVDFGSLDGVGITGRNAPALTIMQIADTTLSVGAFGQSACGTTPSLPSGWKDFPDTCDHLHVQDIPPTGSS